MQLEAPERTRTAYRLAPRPARASLRLAAYVVDWLVMVIVSSLLVAVGGIQLYLVTDSGRESAPDAAVWAFLGISALGLPLWLLSTLAGWSRGGVSIGKLALGLRIVDRRGHAPGLVRATVRLAIYCAETLALLIAPAVIALRLAAGQSLPFWLLPAALLLLAGAALALLPALIAPDGRTLHDRVAGTVVTDV
jgi:uncharacterized RDD family membrane protein YckC